MQKKGTKYIIRESELRNLIFHTVLKEEYGGDAQEVVQDKLEDIAQENNVSPDQALNYFFNAFRNNGGNNGGNFMTWLMGELGLGWLFSLGNQLGQNAGYQQQGNAGQGSLTIRPGKASGKLNGKQTTFINTLYPVLMAATQRNGVSSEFVPTLLAQAGRETGWNTNNVLAVKANNLTGIIAPGSRGKNGYKDLVLPTGGVGGRPSIWEPPGVKGDRVRWYTVFRDVNDWADYYVGDLLGRQYRAFDNGVEGFGRRLFIDGRPDGHGYYGGIVHGDPNHPESVAKRTNYAQYLADMHYTIKQYIDTNLTRTGTA